MATTAPCVQHFRRQSAHAELWKTSLRVFACADPASSILSRSAAARGSLRHGNPREAHLPTKRSPPQAQARLPRAYVDSRRTAHRQAPPRQGAQAPLRLSALPWSAGTAFPAPGTSMPSTGTAGRCRRGSSRCTGSRDRPMRVARRDLASRFRSLWGTRSCATGSSASCARRGASWQTGRLLAGTTFSSHAPALPSQRLRAAIRGSSTR